MLEIGVWWILINSLDVSAIRIEDMQSHIKACILICSLHALILGENVELDRYSDTGGQVKYVVALVKALPSMPSVYLVDLVTRQVACPKVDWSYGEPREMLSSHNFVGMTDEIG
ncbi:hypothetical protein L1987_72569 [Smallanthus sonchifolius]|uniref:Uncharacterized protein n=1 Tax=Smallanthus sonchifolius TaxID=185202 RepID=A0ACB9B002_9ASTR|nr:hypothetical protein L1987_72569 [Smallanthus sonchifolius]